MPITSEQIDQYKKTGFLHIPNAIPVNVLRQWQQLAYDLEQKVRQAPEVHSNVHASSEKEKLILRQNHLLPVYPDALLELLALPAILEIASKFCGRGAVPLSCDLMYKRAGRDSTVLWHQDAPHNRRFPYLNIGIYLDDSPAGDGCLRYVPGSQKKLQDICSLTKQYGWSIPGYMECTAKAGDIIIHDIMVLHCSKAKVTNDVRRTIYLEMRPYDAIVEEGHHSLYWAELRQKWMAMVQRRVRDTAAFGELFDGLPNDVENEAKEIEQLINHREPLLPASYCHEKIMRSDYP
ncbi:phytanoyl-CoA dioxygenase family protein [Marinoscillum furvescens]|uniref:Phytanoyl-CoA dioxygenase PhyH n=1 Tax=Marinoscillum furvescens DSM 4134 TaxID=1122208 RepID=A0A3D9L6C0_MARFU|nr:phytanoyl-CoA dioxygenase family protein [Marinoscillum furvescens]REE01720.1 phytanoyl-CoA dioxygenase PhyH [Marinoscillum furvescens DSM 4134]